MELFRLNKVTTRWLINQIQPFTHEPVKSFGVTTEIKVLCALRFYATGCYQRSIGQDFNCGLSQSSVHRCIREITNVIYEHLCDQHINFPNTRRERNLIKNEFMVRWGFPGAIGAIDCTHIAILKPPIEEHNFINRKGYHSLNVQIICDHNLKINNMFANFGGSTHDSFIWRNSIIQRYLRTLHENGEDNIWLIGDSGYPLQPYLLTPIGNAVEGTPEHRYNVSHIQARNCVERCIGVLKTRFRCI
ncbi:hypothetical protein RN001_005753 [Aquatica leii]|uniref:DDE Tnp4 domain-containing protein n=1 Tax=Aquatica leii TaxID=1421715 RepID=A0AAN7SJ38_9COLE|nr:hypothetical protein RN001_005753 [Aquatica leii]